MIQVMLVDDHHLVRNGFRLILETQDDIVVVADVESAEKAIDFLKINRPPDMILTDINMGEIGVSCLNDYKNYADRAPDRNRILVKYDISEREFHVLELIAEGYTNGEIADRIFLSKRTVEGHRQKLI
ncbi:LuxR C-terminal-related transcriptional regulator [Sphingobacterium sp.]|uniref:response regulator transcription factor n=1 Tax=Sphingobacterium sp. TaxID=341027 RepID=UPI0031E0F996